MDQKITKEEAKKRIEKLRKETNETVYLVVYDQAEIVYLECLESQLRLRARPVYGIRVPLHCTSLGKAIMAFLPDQEVQNIIREKGLIGFTERTIIDQDRLEKELKEIKKRGYGISSVTLDDPSKKMIFIEVSNFKIDLHSTQHISRF